MKALILLIVLAFLSIIIESNELETQKTSNDEGVIVTDGTGSDSTPDPVSDEGISEHTPAVDYQNNMEETEDGDNNNNASFLNDIAPISLHGIIKGIQKSLTGEEEVQLDADRVLENVDDKGEQSTELGNCKGCDNNNNNTVKDAQLVNKTKITKVVCKARNVTEDEDIAVKIVNSSILLTTIVPASNITANECVVVLFYASWCHFSSLASPHYNALARIYPTIYVTALNAITYSSLNTRYGIVAIPTVILFHNGRAVAKFNETDYTLDRFVKFVEKYTGLEPASAVNVTSADFEGPLSYLPIQETDYALLLSWAFVIICCGVGFGKSSLCSYIVETIRNNWHEAEAQHEHVE